MFPAPTQKLVARKYRLVRLISAGGMGAVYEAVNMDTRGRCALKLLRAEVADNADFKERFFREAHACSVVSSDHIVKVFDSGTDDETGSPYLVMEYLEGEDVEATKARLGAMNPSACLKIVLQAAIGLARAHGAGIIHRDIKPANLFLTTNDGGDSIVKILDFGIAKIKVDRLLQTSTGITRSQVLLGTPLYMSPEQCKGAARIDARSDVWSLGVVLWELLAGASPFRQPRSLGALMASIITEELPLIQDLAPWVSSPVAELVHQAMSRDIHKRYGSAAELRDALLRVTPGGPQLQAVMLTRVSLEERSTLAARYELRDRALLSPSPLELAATVSLQPGRTGPRRLGIVALTALFGVLLVIGLGRSLLRGRLRSASSSSPSAARVVPPAQLPFSQARATADGQARATPDSQARASAVPAAALQVAPRAARSSSGAAALKPVLQTVSAAPSSTSAGAAASSAPSAPPIRTDTREFPE